MRQKSNPRGGLGLNRGRVEMKGDRNEMDVRNEIFKASVKVHVLMGAEEQADYPYAYPFDALVNVLAKLEGITDEELDKIGMEAADLAYDIHHILEVQRKNAE